MDHVLLELRKVAHAPVRLFGRLGVRVAGVEQVAHVIVVDVTVGVRVELLEELVHLDVEVVHREHLHLLNEPEPVVVVGKTVVEDAEELVRPEEHQVGWLLEVLLAREEHALHDARKVAQVEGVVRLGGRGEQVEHRCLVHVHRGRDDGGRELEEAHVELLLGEPPVEDRLEDSLHRGVVEGRVRDDVEVAHVARRDRVAPAAGRAHGRDEREVDQLAEDELLAVVPAAVVHPLAQDLNGRLRAVRFERGHVEIIDEDDGALADRRAEDALLALIELGVDDVLRLVAVRLRREVDEDARPFLCIEREDELLHVGRLARAGRAHEEHRLIRLEQPVE